MRIENPRVGGSIPSPDTRNAGVSARRPVHRIPPSTRESGTNRYTLGLLLCLAGCGDAAGLAPVPNIADPLCAWPVHEEIPPKADCVRYTSDDGAHFTVDGATCEGEATLDVPAGAPVYVLGPWTDAHVTYDSDPCPSAGP